MDRWTDGPMEQWTNGPMDRWTNGPMDQNAIHYPSISQNITVRLTTFRHIRFDPIHLRRDTVLKRAARVKEEEANKSLWMRTSLCIIFIIRNYVRIVTIVYQNFTTGVGF